jgi:putative ABC transport system permease protein
VNFVNLSTARSSNRAKEVGMRKTLGAYRNQLLRQFLGEAFLFALLAMAIAVIGVEAILPYFNAFAQKDLHLNLFQDWQLVLGLAGLTLFVGMAAGCYPAFSFSRIPSAEAFRNRRSTGTHAARLRGGLVIFQFAISVALIVGTLIVFNQLRYMQSSKLGFAQEQILVIPAQSVPNLSQRYQAIKQKFRSDPAVLAAAVSSSIPGKTVGEIVYLISHRL